MDVKFPLAGLWGFYNRLPETLRFILVGGYNTAFSIVLYALLYFLLSGWLNYIGILIVTHILSVTNSYFSLKFLVFKTKGNYLREYIRCNITYLASLLLNMGLLYFSVSIMGWNPVISQAVIVLSIAAASYFAHKHFSYR